MATEEAAAERVLEAIDLLAIFADDDEEEEVV